MKFDSIFNESTEVMTVNARLMNKVELKLAKEFQELCKIVHDYAFGEKSKIDWNEDTVTTLIKKLTPYKRFGVCETLIGELEDYHKTYVKMTKSKDRTKESLPSMVKHADDILAALEAGNFDAIDDMSSALGAMIDDIDAHIDLGGESKSTVKKRFSKESNWLFSGGRTELLDLIDGEMYDQIQSLDLDGEVYTYVNFPVNKMVDSIEYLVAFMLNLNKTGKPKRISTNTDFRKYLMLSKAGSDSYKVLADMVEQYLSSNTKSLIPKIVEYINDHPEIKAANNKAKQKIKTVYRGIPGYDDDESGKLTKTEIVMRDKKEYAVATSPNYSAAQNFAYAKGHLESERRSDHGYIIEYAVDPNSIILVTYILGTAYGEQEVLIDPKKARVVTVERV